MSARSFSTSAWVNPNISSYCVENRSYTLKLFTPEKMLSFEILVTPVRTAKRMYSLPLSAVPRKVLMKSMISLCSFGLPYDLFMILSYSSIRIIGALP